MHNKQNDAIPLRLIGWSWLDVRSGECGPMAAQEATTDSVVRL